MLVTVAKFEARPEVRPQLLELARALVEHSRAEKGCLEYGCYQDITTSRPVTRCCWSDAGPTLRRWSDITRAPASGKSQAGSPIWW